METGSFPG